MLVHGGKREIQPDRCNWEHLNAYRVINAKYMQKNKTKIPCASVVRCSRGAAGHRKDDGLNLFFFLHTVFWFMSSARPAPAHR